VSRTRSDVPCAVEQMTHDQVRIAVGDQQFLADAACPHRKGRLAYGVVNGRRLLITCPLHASTFDLRTGRPMAGPATEGLCVRALPCVDREAKEAVEG
jgi:nitrite reductase/ring-hydroxylating ferredoxin subunit